jgi:hypothetical protein
MNNAKTRFQKKVQLVKELIRLIHVTSWEERLLVREGKSLMGFSTWEILIDGAVELSGNSLGGFSWRQIATELSKDMSFVEGHIDNYINLRIQRHGCYPTND